MKTDESEGLTLIRECAFRHVCFLRATAMPPTLQVFSDVDELDIRGFALIDALDIQTFREQIREVHSRGLSALPQLPS